VPFHRSKLVLPKTTSNESQRKIVSCLRVKVPSFSEHKFAPETTARKKSVIKARLKLLRQIIFPGKSFYKCVVNDESYLTVEFNDKPLRAYTGKNVKNENVKSFQKIKKCIVYTVINCVSNRHAKTDMHTCQKISIPKRVEMARLRGKYTLIRVDF
jgi:hypothetical protein